MTAYLLSESSFFVDKNRYGCKGHHNNFSRVMLKTCGTTSPLDCLPKLLELASEKCNLTEVQVVIHQIFEGM